MNHDKYLKYKAKYLQFRQYGGINEESLLDDYIRELSAEQWKELLDKTDRYILKLTEDRVGDNPYWDTRVLWVQNMLLGRIIELPTTKKLTMITIDGYNVPFDFVMDKLYSYITCLRELQRDEINEGKTFAEMVTMIKKVIRNETLLEEEKKFLNKKIYTGQSIKDCLLKNTRQFKKL